MLAELAARAGYSVVSLDYFGDADLRRLCPGISLLRDRDMGYSPEILVNTASELDASYVIYGASLENHPRQVARLAREKSLLGNAPETLQRVRNPQQLADALKAAGFCFPQTMRPGAGLVPDPALEWLWKPLRSGGGHSVQIWPGHFTQEGILQEQLDGLVGSAAFVANGLESVVVGVTEQFVGDEMFGAEGFRYCGNMLPPPLPSGELQDLLAQVRAIVNLLTAEFGLRGLNGLDFVWHEGRVCTLEINPRPTAPLELMEQAYDLHLFDAHVQAFSGQLPQFDLEGALQDGTAAAKAILFAEKDIVISDASEWFGQGIRDIPYPGDFIKQGHPVCTVLVTESSAERCRHKLERRVAELKTWLY